jgi:hypothetical protein
MEQAGGYQPTDVLEHIEFVFPDRFPDFGVALLESIAPFGRPDRGGFLLATSEPGYLPSIRLRFADVAVPAVQFRGPLLHRRISLVPAAGEAPTTVAAHGYLSLSEYRRRAADLGPATLDHVGFDLLWFAGTHPEVLALRAALPGRCAYHRFPTGQDWDFILPATLDEATGGALRPGRIRRPKCEIVSIDTTPVPIVQIDLVVPRMYPDLLRLFPEALVDTQHPSLWVYLDNPFGIDVCFVLNQGTGAGDWSDHLLDHRLRPN